MTHVSHIIPHTGLEEAHMRNNAKRVCLRLPARDLAQTGQIRPKEAREAAGQRARPNRYTACPIRYPHVTCRLPNRARL